MSREDDLRAEGAAAERKRLATHFRKQANSVHSLRKETAFGIVDAPSFMKSGARRDDAMADWLEAGGVSKW